MVLAMLGLLSLIAYVERLNLSVAGVGIKADYGIDDRQLGWIFGAFTLSYALFQIPGGIFGELWGLRRTLTVTCLLWGLITVACGFLPGVLPTSASVFTGLLVLRFLMGAAQAPFFPVLAGTIANWFPVGRWAFPNALTTACLAIGSFLTSYGVAFLMDRYGWRETFYITGPLALAGALAWWLVARDRPREHPAVNAAEIALIERGRAKRGQSPFPPTTEETSGSRIGNGDSPHGRSPHRRVWLDLLRNRETLLLALSYLSMNYVFYIFFSWFFIYLTEERHFTVLNGGFYAGLPWFAAAFGSTIGGELCDRLCRRIGPRWGCRAPAMAGLIIAAALLYFGAVARIHRGHGGTVLGRADLRRARPRAGRDRRAQHGRQPGRRHLLAHHSHSRAPVRMGSRARERLDRRALRRGALALHPRRPAARGGLRPGAARGACDDSRDDDRALTAHCLLHGAS
jgi:ACS family glucarate transporter-like MFS transporter